MVEVRMPWWICQRCSSRGPEHKAESPPTSVEIWVRANYYLICGENCTLPISGVQNFGRSARWAVTFTLPLIRCNVESLQPPPHPPPGPSFPFFFPWLPPPILQLLFLISGRILFETTAHVFVKMPPKHPRWPIASEWHITSSAKRSPLYLSNLAIISKEWTKFTSASQYSTITSMSE